MADTLFHWQSQEFILSILCILSKFQRYCNTVEFLTG